jgi:hypothetical protein
MTTMSKTYTLGCSWAAFKVWSAKWGSLTFRNRLLIRKFVEESIRTTDSIEVVSQDGA